MIVPASYAAGQHAQSTGAAINTNPYLTNPDNALWKLGWLDSLTGAKADPSYARALGLGAADAPPPRQAPWVRGTPNIQAGGSSSSTAGATGATGPAADSSRAVAVAKMGEPAMSATDATSAILAPEVRADAPAMLGQPSTAPPKLWRPDTAPSGATGATGATGGATGATGATGGATGATGGATGATGGATGATGATGGATESLDPAMFAEMETLLAAARAPGMTPDALASIISKINQTTKGGTP